MVTTTSYGSWLPGDLRGYVEDGVVLPGDPRRFRQAIDHMGGRSPVLFTAEQQVVLFESLCDAAAEFGYELADVSVESWHVHWLVGHGFDPVATMVGRLKNRLRQAVGVGRVWTAGYYDSTCFDEAAVLARRRYIGRHVGCRMTGGVRVDLPGQSPGLMDVR